MSYCAHADIETRFQNLSFSSTTNPTDTQVDVMCDQVSDDMDTQMQTVGIVIPVTDTDKLDMLKRIASFGVVAEIYRSLDLELEKAKMYQALYDKELGKILKNPEIITGTDEITNAPSWTGEDRTTTDSDLDEDFNRHGDDW